MRHLLWLTLLTACTAPPPVSSTSSASVVDDDFDCDDDDDDAFSLRAQEMSGKHLFRFETFAGNGRTCETCHSKNTGTFSPADAQALYARNPDAPLFRAIDSDDGLGVSYNRLLTDATVRIPFTLPANAVMLEDPAARAVVLNRSTPTVNNVVFTQSLLMVDGREPSLEHQAVSAVHTHYQPGREPTADEAAAIAAFQRTLFTSKELRRYAVGGSAPGLPAGRTASEIRGRRFFDDTRPDGLCAQCHGGPLLDTVDSFNLLQPAGDRLSATLVSELQPPQKTFVFTTPVDHVTFFPPVGVVTIPAGTQIAMVNDPGRALTTGDPCADLPLVCVLAGPGRANSVFKIPSLRGIAKTAPYFHDNSAKTLEQVMDHYETFFAITAAGLGDPSFLLSAQDKVDIAAFMRLL